MVSPTGCLEGARRVMMIMKASGMNDPPASPCKARRTIISPRLLANVQPTLKTRNRNVLASRYVRTDSARASHHLKGITTISATRKAVTIQPPSSTPAPIAPWISARDELTTWIFRIARKAPSAEPTTPSQVLAETSGSAFGLVDTAMDVV